jgi:hypothetical protein
MDDRSVQAVHVQASTDGGRTWGFIARDLPPVPGAFDWAVPPAAAESDLHVKVVAVDGRFQDSADGGGVVPLPGPVAHLMFSDAVTLTWDADPLAAFYDVVRGHADLMHAGGSVADAICVSENGPDASWSDAAAPGPGRIFYYLVRGDTPAGQAGTYADSLADPGWRDAQIGTTGNTDCTR